MRRAREGGSATYVRGVLTRRAAIAHKRAIARAAAPPQIHSLLTAGLALRRARIEAYVRAVRPEWPDHYVRAEVALAMNGFGFAAVVSCESGSRAVRRAYGQRASAYDHLLVGTASEPESGPELRWKHQRPRGR